MSILALACAFSLAAQAVDEDGIKGNLRLIELLQLLHRFGGGVALFHQGQDAVAAALQPDVQKAQAQPVQLLELLDRFVPQIFDRGVHRNAGAVGQILFDLDEDFPHLLKGQAERLAANQEHPFGVGVVARGVPQVGDDLPEGDHLEVDRLVHVAEGAAVVGAAGGHLQQKRVPLKGRVIDNLIVTHESILLSFDAVEVFLLFLLYPKFGKMKSPFFPVLPGKKKRGETPLLYSLLSSGASSSQQASICCTRVNWVLARSRFWSGRAILK